MKKFKKMFIGPIAGMALIAVPVGVYAQSTQLVEDSNVACVEGICDLWLVGGLSVLAVVGIVGFGNPKSN